MTRLFGEEDLHIVRHPKRHSALCLHRSCTNLVLITLRLHHFDVKTIRTVLVHTYRMAKQDDWVRLTIRIPKDLHERVIRGSVLSSVNTEIIRSIERQFPPEPSNEELADDIEYFLGALETTNMPDIRQSLQKALRKYSDRLKEQRAAILSDTPKYKPAHVRRKLDV